MGTCTVPLEGALGDIVSSDDLTADQKIRAIQAAVNECQNDEIIEQLKKMNTYLSIMVGCNL